VPSQADPIRRTGTTSPGTALARRAADEEMAEIVVI
jgi:hypothetical protein